MPDWNEGTVYKYNNYILKPLTIIHLEVNTVELIMMELCVGNHCWKPGPSSCWTPSIDIGWFSSNQIKTRLSYNSSPGHGSSKYLHETLLVICQVFSCKTKPQIKTLSTNSRARWPFPPAQPLGAKQCMFGVLYSYKMVRFSGFLVSHIYTHPFYFCGQTVCWAFCILPRWIKAFCPWIWEVLHIYFWLSSFESERDIINNCIRTTGIKTRTWRKRKQGGVTCLVHMCMALALPQQATDKGIHLHKSIIVCATLNF